MRTSRQVAEKLGTVGQDPDLNGLLFILISRATGGRQERAAQLCPPQGDTLRKRVKLKMHIFTAASSRGHPRTTRGYPRPGGNVTKKGRGYPRDHYVPDPPTVISPAAGDIPGPRRGHPGPPGDVPGRASGMSPTSGDIPSPWRGASPTGSGISPALRGMSRPRLGVPHSALHTLKSTHTRDQKRDSTGCKPLSM